MKTASANQVQVGLDPGVTPAGAGLDEVVWNILGHTYYLKAEGANYVIENEFDLYLDGQHHKAHAGELVRLPAGIAHGYYNLSSVPTRAMFWVAPGRRLRELFDVLHNMNDPEQVVREAAQREVHFLNPADYAFDPLALREAGQP